MASYELSACNADAIPVSLSGELHVCQGNNENNANLSNIAT